MVSKPHATGLCLLLLALLAGVTLTACSTAPRQFDQKAVLAATRNATADRTANMPALRDRDIDAPPPPAERRADAR